MSPWQVLLTLSLVDTVLGVAVAVLTLTLTNSAVCTLSASPATSPRSSHALKFPQHPRFSLDCTLYILPPLAAAPSHFLFVVNSCFVGLRSQDTFQLSFSLIWAGLDTPFTVLPVTSFIRINTAHGVIIYLPSG